MQAHHNKAGSEELDRLHRLAAEQRRKWKENAAPQTPAADVLKAIGGSSEPRRCAYDHCSTLVDGVEMNGRTVYLGRYCEHHANLLLEQEQAAAAARTKAAQTKARREWLVEQWGNGSKYHDAQPVLCPRPQALALALAWDYRTGTNLMLIGESGRGKTHIAYIVSAILVMDLGVKVEVWQGIPLRQAIVKAARDDRNDARERLVNSIIAAPVLILDDIGHMASTESSREALLEIMEGRSSRRRPTIITSQFEGPRFIERFAPSEETGKAVARRMGEGATKVYMDPKTEK